LMQTSAGISGTDIFRVGQLKLKWTRPERINRRKVNSFINLQHFCFCSSLFKNAPFSHGLPYLTLWQKPWNKKRLLLLALALDHYYDIIKSNQVILKMHRIH
jgi:hypothetical protein